MIRVLPATLNVSFKDGFYLKEVVGVVTDILRK